ncbi:hypothetical protein CDEN61S_02794 [Castellaniella denitrificans]
MKYIVHVFHRLTQAFLLTHITYIEPQIRVIERYAHIFLLFLISTKNTDLLDIRI